MAAQQSSAQFSDDSVSVLIVPVMASQPESDFGWIPFTFSMVLAEPSDVALRVYWRAVGSGDNPATPNDFAASVESPGWIELAPGETSKTFKVFAWGEEFVELDEGFTVTAYDPSTGDAIGQATDGIFLNDDAAVAISALDATGREGTGETTEYSFTVTRTGDFSVSHSVGRRVSGSGSTQATASDFAGGVMPERSLTFAPGETSKVIKVPVIGDALVEADEDFLVSLLVFSSGWQRPPLRAQS